MIDKTLQLALLRMVATTYPSHAMSVWDDLLALTPGGNREEKMTTLVQHLMALQDFGYIRNFGQVSVDGRVSINQGFSITPQGLLEAGEDVLHPDPHKELRQALFDQAQALRVLSEPQKKTLKGVLSGLPGAALEHLQGKGLDALLAFVAGLV